MTTISLVELENRAKVVAQADLTNLQNLADQLFGEKILSYFPSEAISTGWDSTQAMQLVKGLQDRVTNLPIELAGAASHLFSGNVWSDIETFTHKLFSELSAEEQKLMQRWQTYMKDNQTWIAFSKDPGPASSPAPAASTPEASAVATENVQKLNLGQALGQELGMLMTFLTHASPNTALRNDAFDQSSLPPLTTSDVPPPDAEKTEAEAPVVSPAPEQILPPTPVVEPVVVAEPAPPVVSEPAAPTSEPADVPKSDSPPAA